MKLFDLRKQLKSEFASLNIETEDVDFIMAEVLGVKRTDLILIDEIPSDNENEIKKFLIAQKKRASFPCKKETRKICYLLCFLLNLSTRPSVSTSFC